MEETLNTHENTLSAFRYVVNISFKNSYGSNIAEPVKTLKEAQQYKTIVDETVRKACIVDKVTGKVVEWWAS